MALNRNDNLNKNLLKVFKKKVFKFFSETKLLNFKIVNTISRKNYNEKNIFSCTTSLFNSQFDW